MWLSGFFAKRSSPGKFDDREAASELVTVVLETFSEILYRSERDTLSAPLPKALARLVQSSTPERTREKVERLNAEAGEPFAFHGPQRQTAHGRGLGGQQDQT